MKKICVLGMVLLCFALRGEGGEIAALVSKLNELGAEGSGTLAGQAAWREVAAASASELPTLLAAIDPQRPIAANWLCAAIDAVAERTLVGGEKLPLDGLEAFLADRKQAPRARRLAYELILRANPGAADRLLSTMLDDPSVELRRDAVAQVLDEAGKLQVAGENERAADTFERALKAARDEDQIKLASDELKNLGRTVDLPSHFGFITTWQLIGPFDNVGGKGYAVAYPPEQGVDFSQSYTGKEGAVKWSEHTTADDYGKVDLNAAIGKVKGAVTYAATEFDSSQKQSVELRFGTIAANKVWVNGKLVFEAEIYHALSKVDQYLARAELRPGRNVILVKLCQNEQTEPWAQDWAFQLRVCDATGGAILSTNRKSQP